MVQINFALKEVNCKIVFYGPGMSGKTTNLEIDGWVWETIGDWLTIGVLESAQGQDLNGDGDADNLLKQVFNVAEAAALADSGSAAGIAG